MVVAMISVNTPSSNTLNQSNNFTMLVSLTVGKVDAGVAVLLTEDKRLVSSHILILPSLPEGSVAYKQAGRILCFYRLTC
jgi:hypothetical protein